MSNYISLYILEKDKIKNCLLEEVNLKEIQFINESLGSFNKQPEIAINLAKTYLDMLDNGKGKIDTVIEIDNEKIDTQLVLVKNKSLLKSYATTEPYGNIDNGDIILEKLVFTLYLREFDLFSLDRETLYSKIVSIINHELMHGNIFSKRISNKQDISVVDWYEDISKIINYEKNDLVRYIAYGMYACYYQERQAIISSTYGQLLGIFNDDRTFFIGYKIKRLSEEEKYSYLLKAYKKSLVKTESYQTFILINDICNRITDEEIEKVNKIFIGYGVNVNLRKEVKKMKIISNEALKDVIRNGSLFFYEFLLKKFNVKG